MVYASILLFEEQGKINLQMLSMAMCTDTALIISRGLEYGTYVANAVQQSHTARIGSSSKYSRFSGCVIFKQMFHFLQHSLSGQWFQQNEDIFEKLSETGS